MYGTRNSSQQRCGEDKANSRWLRLTDWGAKALVRRSPTLPVVAPARPDRVLRAQQHQPTAICEHFQPMVKLC